LKDAWSQTALAQSGVALFISLECGQPGMMTLAATTFDHKGSSHWCREAAASLQMFVGA
jgi:hypothetical protein